MAIPYFEVAEPSLGLLIEFSFHKIEKVAVDTSLVDFAIHSTEQERWHKDFKGASRDQILATNQNSDLNDCFYYPLSFLIYIIICNSAKD